MNKIKTTSGVVKKMREIRDSLSQEIINMTFEQQKEYTKNILDESKKKKAIRDDTKARVKQSLKEFPDLEL